MHGRFIGAVLAISVLLAAHPARADAIDGAWCRDGNLRLMINGPVILTAAGSKTQGDYSRHAFSYIAPSGDPGSGTTISMYLVNEDTMQLRAGAQAPIETWLRCGPPVS